MNAPVKDAEKTFLPRKVAGLVGIGLAIVCAAIVYSWYTLHQVQQVFEPRQAALAELRYLATSSYLESEKIAAGDTTARLGNIEQFIKQTDSIYNKFTFNHLPAGIKKITGFYHEFSEAFRDYDSIKVLLRIRHAENTGIPSHTYDRAIDTFYYTFRNHLYSAERTLQQEIMHRFSWFIVIQLILLLTCVGIAIALGYLYYHFARRHRLDLESLAKKNGELDIALQEKLGSEQHLKAANQQLRADEQQLKAANQQLKAHEQQLRAVNQQLRASEQQFKATNQQLKANEQVLRIYKKSVEHAEDLIAAVNSRHEFVFINSAFGRYYRVTQETVAGKTVDDIMGSDALSGSSGAFIDRAFAGERVQYEISHAFEGLGVRTLLVSYYPLTNDNNTGAIVIQVLRDVSDRKRVEDERQKVQRLETVGQLAAGIAHDFNNILSGIFGFINLAKMSLPGQGDAAKYLEGALSAFSRAKDLTQQLLTFAKGGSPVKKQMYIEPVIKEAAALSLSGSSVRPVIRITDKLLPVNIDEGQIHQVLSNLFINSRQAMPDGGEIVIQATNRDVTTNEIIDLPAGRYVTISVKDSGIGIAPEHLARIFEPFFTTKQQGSGLGLSICFSIIKKHGGHIAVESALGAGSTFTLYLPALERVAHPAALQQNQPLPGQGAILVMDDDKHVLYVTEHILAHAGYTVAVSKNGDEAIEMYQKALAASAPFRAVILDLTVPGGMGGFEAFTIMRKLDPHVRGIVTSGYASDPIMADYQTFGFAGAVKKPSYPAEILEAVASAVNTNRG